MFVSHKIQYSLRNRRDFVYLSFVNFLWTKMLNSLSSSTISQVPSSSVLRPPGIGGWAKSTIGIRGYLSSRCRGVSRWDYPTFPEKSIAWSIALAVVVASLTTSEDDSPVSLSLLLLESICTSTCVGVCPCGLMTWPSLGCCELLLDTSLASMIWSWSVWEILIHSRAYDLLLMVWYLRCQRHFLDS